jgi:DNA-binding Lrp family transcriptional regulator
MIAQTCPNEIAKLCKLVNELQRSMKLDKISQKILQELTRDGRLPNTQLAERVGLSPSACLRRVQELERAGIIAGYRAVLDPAALGRGFVAYVTVGLADHTKEAQATFEAAVAGFAEVRECHNITGTVEYLLRVEAADLAAYKSFHTDCLGTVPGVHRLVTHVVMGSPKDERA